MQDTAYKNINTQIRVFELSLFKPEDFDKMLRADSLRSALDLLKGTPYYFDEEEILQTKNFDQFLMTRLKNVYDELYALTPDKEVIQIYSLRYSYHNLKVRSEEHTSELQSRGHLVCRLLLEKITDI